MNKISCITLAFTSSQESSDNEKPTYSDQCSMLYISTKSAGRTKANPAFANPDIPADLCCHTETSFMATRLFCVTPNTHIKVCRVVEFLLEG